MKISLLMQKETIKYDYLTKLYASMLAATISPLVRKTPKEIYRLILKRDKEKLYEIFIENPMIRLISLVVLYMISTFVAYILFRISLLIINGMFKSKQEYMKQYLRPFFAENSKSLDCIRDYATNARLLEKFGVYTLTLAQTPAYTLASIIGVKPALSILNKSTNLYFYMAKYTLMLIESPLPKNDIVKLLNTIAKTIGLENFDIEKAYKDVNNVFENLKQRFERIYKTGERLAYHYGKLENIKEEPIFLRSVKYFYHFTLASANYVDLALRTAGNIPKVHQEVSVIQHYLDMLKHLKLNKRTLVKSSLILLIGFIFKLVLRFISREVYTRKGLGYFVVIASIFLILELFIECNAHKQILKVIKET